MTEFLAEVSPPGERRVPEGQLTAPPEPSPRCANCQATLAGHYCHQCGQPDREVVRFFGSLTRDFLAEVFSLDSRAARTLAALCTRPGFLTNAYLSGRRYRYVAPLRLFLLTSLLCIFAVWSLNLARGTSVVMLNGGADATGEATVVPTELSVRLPGLSPENQQQLQRRLERSLDKIQEDPGDFVDDLLEIIPNSMLLLVPLFALYMRLIYPLAHRYYIEHLIHALHGHAFLFVMILGLMLIESAIAATGASWLVNLLGLLETAVMVWIPVYLLLSVKAVYRQGWGMTVFKTWLLGVGYLVLLAIATVLTVLIGVLLT